MCLLLVHVPVYLHVPGTFSCVCFVGTVDVHVFVHVCWLSLEYAHNICCVHILRITCKCPELSLSWGHYCVWAIAHIHSICVCTYHHCIENKRVNTKEEKRTACEALSSVRQWKYMTKFHYCFVNTTFCSQLQLWLFLGTISTPLDIVMVTP